MHVEEFWALIDAARAGLDTTDPPSAVEEQVDALRVLLDDLTDARLLAFQQRVSEQTARADDWRLWAAGYLAAGGMSDDAFDDFRLWLVLQGRETFERLLTRPDLLADVPWDDGGGAFSAAEELGHLVEEILRGRGTDAGDALVPAAPASRPCRDPFDEQDDEWSSRVFPRLSARLAVAADALGHHPDPSPTAGDVPDLPTTPRDAGFPQAVEPVEPLLAAALYERGHLHPHDRPMLAAHWLAEDRGGEAVLELASMRGHEPDTAAAAHGADPPEERGAVIGWS
ncbi:DUF4240 domain-containing protein [Geodermatophilus sp. DSM 44513]|uniref:DUF4240 domain-containing protein n=1 Tax=Geodermatophilus sp. DSM 44513 TaxID=1528104 RepID=UPI001270B53F|nr:DUF4240 domain-containing protein [Geodermatophilus sp. DSM 44513]WNV75828.1 DUF4240 domain-containing protein [Geodermatophilus sp. DSM 44513]